MDNPDPRVLDIQEAIWLYIRIGLLDKSPLTVEWHEKRMGILGRELAGYTVRSLTQELVLHAQANLAMCRYKATYVHSIIRAWKGFFAFLDEFGYTEKDLGSALKLPRLPKTGRKGIEDGDVERIYQSMSADDWWTVRDLAIITLLDVSGIRVSGLCDLQMGAFDVNHRRFIVTEKFSKQRYAFLDETGETRLRRWLKMRAMVKARCENLFITHTGLWLAPDTVYEIICRRAKIAQVNGNFSPHQWRHRFARRMAKNGMPLGTIAQLMGHSNVKVTVDYYGMFAVDELQASYDKYIQKSSVH